MFTCAICGNSYDDSLLNEHHRIPRAFGGDDSKENLRFLCAGCHQTLHRLAEHFLNPHKAGKVRDIARVYCSQFSKPERSMLILLDLSKCACDYELRVKKGDLKLSPWSEKVISTVIPMKFKKAFENSCKMKTIFGRKGSMQAVIEDFVLSTLHRECPYLRPDIEKYRFSRLRK